MKLISIILASLILILALCGIASASPAQQTYIDKIDEYVMKQMSEGQIPGLALGIVENGEIIYLKGYGTADGNGTPATPQTPFTMGSITKTVTALGIRQLVNQGKIDYNAPVQKYIPWFTLADSEAAAKIRIIDLLNHRSGLSRASGNMPTVYNEKYSTEQIVRNLSTVMPNRAVGLLAEYSNLNFIILGLVIEKVSGMGYEQYIQQNIIEPLEFKNTYPSSRAAGSNKLAQGHYVAFGTIIPNYEPLPIGSIPAGFQVSSAEDLTHYALLYLNNGYYNGQSIIPNNTLERKSAPYEELKQTDERYDIYWNIQTGKSNGYLGFDAHSGATNGFTSVLLVNPVYKRAIVVLANCRNTLIYPEISAETIGCGIAYIFNTGLILPDVQHDKPGLWINIVAALIILALLLFRILWTRRFVRAINRPGVRRVLSIASFVIIDVLLPLTILVGAPLYLDCNWIYLLNSNMELWYLLFTISILLVITCVKKMSMLLFRISGKHGIKS